jgi:dihydrofolate reductase
MRPVVLQMGVTLDGFVHGAKGYEDWGLPPEEDEVVAWKAASLREAGTHIMGRVTYEEMAAVWPAETGVYADVMNEIPKVVFSATLTRAEYRLVIHPVAIGHGTGLFSSLAKPLRLELVEAQTYPSGTAIKIYRPRVN